jgi:hypothetical protein
MQIVTVPLSQGVAGVKIGEGAYREAPTNLNYYEAQVFSFDWQPGDATRYNFVFVKNRNWDMLTLANLSKTYTIMLPHDWREYGVHPDYIREKTGANEYNAQIISDFISWLCQKDFREE